MCGSHGVGASPLTTAAKTAAAAGGGAGAAPSPMQGCSEDEMQKFALPDPKAHIADPATPKGGGSTSTTGVGGASGGGASDAANAAGALGNPELLSSLTSIVAMMAQMVQRLRGQSATATAGASGGGATTSTGDATPVKGDPAVGKGAVLGVDGSIDDIRQMVQQIQRELAQDASQTGDPAVPKGGPDGSPDGLPDLPGPGGPGGIGRLGGPGGPGSGLDPASTRHHDAALVSDLVGALRGTGLSDAQRTAARNLLTHLQDSMRNPAGSPVVGQLIDLESAKALLPLDAAGTKAVDGLIAQAVALRTAEAGGKPDPGGLLSLRLNSILATAKLDSTQKTTLEGLVKRVDAARADEQRYGVVNRDEVQAINAELRTTLGAAGPFGGTLLSLANYDPNAKPATTTTTTTTT